MSRAFATLTWASVARALVRRTMKFGQRSHSLSCGGMSGANSSSKVFAISGGTSRLMAKRRAISKARKSSMVSICMKRASLLPVAGSWRSRSAYVLRARRNACDVLQAQLLADLVERSDGRSPSGRAVTGLRGSRHARGDARTRASAMARCPFDRGVRVASVLQEPVEPVHQIGGAADQPLRAALGIFDGVAHARSSCRRKLSMRSNISPICPKVLSIAIRSPSTSSRPSSIVAAMPAPIYSSARTCMVSACRRCGERDRRSRRGAIRMIDGEDRLEVLEQDALHELLEERLQAAAHSL